MDPLQELIEIEAIKRLKARYIRSIDTKDWDALSDAFARDARSLYNDGEYCLEGRDAIVGFLRDALADTSIAAMHQAHTPEVEMTSDTTARGTWYLEALGTNPADVRDGMPHGSVMHETGIYSDEYVRLGDEWKIALTGYRRIFLVVQPLDPATHVQTRWTGLEGRG